MTGSLILNLALSVGIVVVIVGMFVSAILADRRGDIATGRRTVVLAMRRRLAGEQELLILRCRCEQARRGLQLRGPGRRRWSVACRRCPTRRCSLLPQRPR